MSDQQYYRILLDDYCHSRFPGEDVDSFRHLNHENPDAEIALIEWQPIKPVKLKENAHE